MSDHEVFELGPVSLQCGLTLPRAHLAWRSYGRLNAERSNLILYPTSYGAQHGDIDWLIGPGRILDPERWFIVIPNQFGNGLSTSPSNLEPPFGQGRNPLFTHWDNIHAQERLVTERFDVERIALVYGWSMGGQVAWHMASLFPGDVANLIAICATANARTLSTRTTTSSSWRATKATTSS